MTFLSQQNKFLRLASGVVLAPVPDVVIAKLDRYFARANHTAWVTSVLRTPEQQLGVIRKYAVLKEVDKEYPEILTCKVEDKDANGVYYKWQWAWSRLLNIGIIINPPVAAKCLFDYYRRGVNMKGRIIPPSIHSSGLAFDIGGRAGVDPTPVDELEIVTEAMSEEPAIGIASLLLERGNNCLHVNCKKA